MLKNEKLQLAIFCLVHAVILLPLFNTIYHMPYSSVVLYLDYASKVMGGNLPYRDFFMEYPPLALVFFILPRFFGSALSVYAGAFQIEVLLFDLIGLYLIYRIAKITGRAPWIMLSVYSAALLAVGPIIIESYDIFPAILTLLSIYLFITGRHKTAWLIIALGFMTKFYPALIAPVFIFYYLRTSQYKRIWSGIRVFAAACLIIALPFLITTPGSFLNILTMHGSRPLQLETTYSSVLLIINRLTNTVPEFVFSAGSANIVGPVADKLASLGLLVMVSLLLPAYWLIYSRIANEKSQLQEMGAYSLLVISVVLITSKILSPQYLVWLFPLLPLISGRKGIITTIIFVSIGVLTYYIYPLHYTELGDVTSAAVVVLLVRNTLLAIFTVLIGVFIFMFKVRKNIN